MDTTASREADLPGIKQKLSQFLVQRTLSPQEFTQLLSKKSLCSLGLLQGRRVITVHSGTNVGECLAILERQQILSVPVVDQGGKLIANVDLLDITLWLISLFPTIRVENLTSQDISQLLQTGSKLYTTPISEVIELATLAFMYYDARTTITMSTTLEKAMDMFYMGLHRVTVVDENSLQVINILSQTDILSLIAQFMPYLNSEDKKRKIGEINLVQQSITPVKHNTPTLKALAMMNTPKKQALALPVVDDSGALVATLSVSNLRSINARSLVSLVLPVMVFLQTQSADNQHTLRTTLDQYKSLHPITCQENSTFESVVLQMTAYKVHRVWVVDAKQKPIGVVTIADVFKMFLPWTWTPNPEVREPVVSK